MRPLVIIMMVTIALVHLPIHTINAAEDTENPILAREQLFRQIEALYQIPWYFLGAIDQYERNVRNARRDLPDAAQDEPIAIRYPDKQWVGPLNPNLTDKNPYSIQLFGGLGVDGNDDGRANPDDGMDALMSTVRFLSAYGIDELSLRTAIWELYHDPKTVDIITHTAKIYATIGTMNLTDNHFPVSLHHNYTYRSTWGAKRGWGGRRIHEGTDVFANHGTPVYSTVYGYIEAKGWNKYGGWRIWSPRCQQQLPLLRAFG